jgi:hypothetical protein
MLSTFSRLCPPIIIALLAPEPSLVVRAARRSSPSAGAYDDDDDEYAPLDETQGYRHAIDCASSIGMFSSAPLILRLNSAWRGVDAPSAPTVAEGGAIDGDPVPGGGVAVPPLLLFDDDDDDDDEEEDDIEFGSPFSPADRIRRKCSRLESLSKVMPRFFSTDSTDARHMSTRSAERSGMNRSPE